jgi:hypothetical protein
MCYQDNIIDGRRNVTMEENDFVTISIKGRVAFAICCLENAIKHFNYNPNEWRIVLEKLWAYTNIEFFDDWHYSIAEILPESILEFDIYEEENFEYLEEEQFEMLQKLYNSSNATVKDIIKFIFDIGISEFYGRLENHGQRTLDKLKILINYMVSNGIQLPDINILKIFSYDDGDGWGINFDGTKYSSILGNQ